MKSGEEVVDLRDSYFRFLVLKVLRKKPLLLYYICRWGEWKPFEGVQGRGRPQFDPRHLLEDIEQDVKKFAKDKFIFEGREVYLAWTLIRAKWPAKAHKNLAKFCGLTKDGERLYAKLKESGASDYILEHYDPENIESFSRNFVSEFRVEIDEDDLVEIELEEELTGIVPDARYAFNYGSTHRVSIEHKLKNELKLHGGNEIYCEITLSCKENYYKGARFVLSQQELRSNLVSRTWTKFKCPCCDKIVYIAPDLSPPKGLTFDTDPLEITYSGEAWIIDSLENVVDSGINNAILSASSFNLSNMEDESLSRFIVRKIREEFAHYCEMNSLDERTVARSTREVDDLIARHLYDKILDARQQARKAFHEFSVALKASLQKIAKACFEKAVEATIPASVENYLTNAPKDALQKTFVRALFQSFRAYYDRELDQKIPKFQFVKTCRELINNKVAGALVFIEGEVKEKIKLQEKIVEGAMQGFFSTFRGFLTAKIVPEAYQARAIEYNDAILFEIVKRSLVEEGERLWNSELKNKVGKSVYTEVLEKESNDRLDSLLEHLKSEMERFKRNLIKKNFEEITEKAISNVFSQVLSSETTNLKDEQLILFLREALPSAFKESIGTYPKGSLSRAIVSKEFSDIADQNNSLFLEEVKNRIEALKTKFRAKIEQAFQEETIINFNDILPRQSRFNLADVSDHELEEILSSLLLAKVNVFFQFDSCFVHSSALRECFLEVFSKTKDVLIVRAKNEIKRYQDSLRTKIDKLFQEKAIIDIDNILTRLSSFKLVDVSDHMLEEIIRESLLAKVRDLHLGEPREVRLSVLTDYFSVVFEKSKDALIARIKNEIKRYQDSLRSKIEQLFQVEAIIDIGDILSRLSSSTLVNINDHELEEILKNLLFAKVENFFQFDSCFVHSSILIEGFFDVFNKMKDVLIARAKNEIKRYQDKSLVLFSNHVSASLLQKKAIFVRLAVNSCVKDSDWDNVLEAIREEIENQSWFYYRTQLKGIIAEEDFLRELKLLQESVSKRIVQHVKKDAKQLEKESLQELRVSMPRFVENAVRTTGFLILHYEDSLKEKISQTLLKEIMDEVTCYYEKSFKTKIHRTIFFDEVQVYLAGTFEKSIQEVEDLVKIERVRNRFRAMFNDSLEQAIKQLLARKSKINEEKVKEFALKDFQAFLVREFPGSVTEPLFLEYKRFLKENASHTTIAKKVDEIKMTYSEIFLCTDEIANLLLKTACEGAISKEEFIKKVENLPIFKEKQVKIASDTHADLYFKLTKVARRTLVVEIFYEIIKLFTSWDKEFEQEFSRNAPHMFKNRILKIGSGTSYPIGSAAELKEQLNYYNSLNVGSKISPLDVLEASVRLNATDFSEVALLVRSACSRKSKGEAWKRIREVLASKNVEVNSIEELLALKRVNFKKASGSGNARTPKKGRRKRKPSQEKNKERVIQQ